MRRPPEAAQALAQRLRALPEASRDTLLVVVVAALSLAPLLPRMPGWAAVCAGALLLWRGALAGTGRRLPPRALLAGLLALAVAAVLLQFRSVFGRDPGVSLVGMLLGLKLLETRRRRDAYVVFYLGLFCVFAQFLYSQSAAAAAWMLLCTVGWLTALLDANLPASRPPLWRRIALSARLLGLGLPVMVALFVLFPRLSGPLWSLPDSSRTVSALGSSMDPGAIASLARSSNVVFRVRFHGPRPPQAAMYWRGPVLARFDGHRWSELPQAAAPRRRAQPLRRLGGRVRYTVTQQPTQRRFAFALDAPAAAPTLVGEPGASLRLLPDLELRASRRLDQVVRFRATSWLGYAYGADESPRRLRESLQLPAGYDPRTVALGRRLGRRYAAAGAQALADAVLRRFREQPFHYSLHPGRYRGPDSIDQFLFVRRVGFCEHFAQAFVVLMRAAGIPARIVTGYQGGSENPIDGMWVVRQRDAHAWAEYWVPGAGWIRADPTAMVDPARIDRSGQTLDSRQPLFGLPLLGRSDVGALRLLRNLGDALDEGWNQWVLDYGQLRQRQLLRRLGMRRPDSARLASAAALALSLLLGAGGLWLLWRRRAATDPWQRAYARLLRRLRRLGVQAWPGEPPGSLAQRLGARAELAEACELLLDFERARYARGSPRGGLRGLRARVARLRLSSGSSPPGHAAR